MKLLIVGDSHTGALHRGLLQLRQQKGKELDDILIWPLGGGHLLPTQFFRDAGTHAEIIEPFYARNVRRLPPLRPTGIGAIGLSMPLWPSRTVYNLRMKKQALVGFHGAFQPISREVFRQLVLSDQKYVLELTEILLRLGLPVAAISAPSLFRDNVLLRQGEPLDTLAMFNLYRSIMKEELTARGVDIIDIPEECLDDDGFMLDRYRHPDPKDNHHANADFGALMIEQCLAWQDHWPQDKLQGAQAAAAAVRQNAELQRKRNRATVLRGKLRRAVAKAQRVCSRVWGVNS